MKQLNKHVYGPWALVTGASSGIGEETKALPAEPRRGPARRVAPWSGWSRPGSRRPSRRT